MSTQPKYRLSAREWFRVNSEGFIENEDFSGCTRKSAPNQNGITQELQDYKMTLDMSKHICMMSRNIYEQSSYTRPKIG